MTHEITENKSFNTQPPEGGWGSAWAENPNKNKFQHTAA